MNGLKKIIILIIAVIIILAIIVLIINKDNNINNNILNNEKILHNEKEDIVFVGEVKNTINYYTAKDCANKYIKYIKEENKEVVCKLLDKTYIQKENITIENSIDKLGTIKKDEFFSVQSMYQTIVNSYTNKYYIYGILRDENNNVVNERTIYLTVILNDNVQEFYIIPEKNNFPKELQNLEDIKKEYTISKTYQSNSSVNVLKNNQDTPYVLEGKGEYYISNNDEVNVDTINHFEYTNITGGVVARDYFNNYKQNCKYDIEKAYNSLDEEYRIARFGSLENFKRYIQDNYKNISEMIITDYIINIDDKFNTKYICKDQNNNYYMFNEIAIMKYTVVLDKYTIDLPEFIEKYNSTNEQGKTALNIQKFFEAINSKDYNYAYNCLSDGFKNNYFQTLDNFTTYINSNLYTTNNIEYKEFKAEGELYLYTIKITNSNNSDNNIEKTIIMKLNEGTNFEMSFNI